MATLKKGSSGPDVVRLQEKLREFGFDPFIHAVPSSRVTTRATSSGPGPRTGARFTSRIISLAERCSAIGEQARRGRHPYADRGRTREPSGAWLRRSQVNPPLSPTKHTGVFIRKHRRTTRIKQGVGLDSSVQGQIIQQRGRTWQ